MTVNRYSLFLKQPGLQKDVLIWVKELTHMTKEPWLSAHNGSFRVADLVLRGDKGVFVLTHVGNFYSVSNVRRDLDGTWFETSHTDLARDLEFQPIVKC